MNAIATTEKKAKGPSTGMIASTRRAAGTTLTSIKNAIRRPDAGNDRNEVRNRYRAAGMLGSKATKLAAARPAMAAAKKKREASKKH
jgi:hypothetical protein